MGNKAIIMKDIEGNKIYPCPYYPVGSIYMSVNNINPAKFFGGTWEQIKDRFLLACGSIYNAGTTGGESTHKLTVNEMPKHRHNKLYIDLTQCGMAWVTNSGSGTPVRALNPQDAGEKYDGIYSGYEGGDQAHNNMPPYLAVYVWKRIK